MEVPLTENLGPVIYRPLSTIVLYQHAFSLLANPISQKEATSWLATSWFQWPYLCQQAPWGPLQLCMVPWSFPALSSAQTALLAHGSLLAPNINMETALPFCLRTRLLKPQLQGLSSLCLGPFPASTLACSSSCPRQRKTQEGSARFT